MPFPSTSVRRAARLLPALAACAVVAAGCQLAPAPTTTPSGAVSIMGASAVSASQIVSWFQNHAQPAGPYAASVPIGELAQIFVEEGAAEGVRGDVAFIQSVVETGYFRFGGSVPASYNNFSGLGATGATGASIASFPDARTGVRAQIQHLRRYADATATTCTMPPLHNPCVDSRFAAVVPPGKATTWNEMGNGNWATSTTYASTILNLYSSLRVWAGLAPV